MRRRQLTLVLLAMAVPICCVYIATAETPQDNWSETLKVVTRSLGRVLPEELKAAARIVASPDAAETVEALSRIVSQARVKVATAQPGPGVRNAVVDGYIGTWELVAFAYAHSADAGRRREISKLWDLYLGEDQLVPYQISSLLGAWEPGLLTERFWSLVDESESPRVLSAIAAVLAERGTRREAERLKAALAHREGRNNTEILSLALAYWEYDHGEPGRSMPKEALPPPF